MLSGKFIFEAKSMSSYPCKIPESIEKGGRVIMPQSLLSMIMRQYFDMPPSPMLFKIHSNSSRRISHCGVEQFSNYEGRIYLPHWMMKNLLINEGDKVSVTHLTLPEANFVKFQPQSVDFLDIFFPKAVLEKSLRQFSCLTVGDILAIEYNNKIYEILVMEVKPENAVKIIECDVNVEFAAPVGYEDEDQTTTCTEETEAEKAMKKEEQKLFKPFCGTGNRLDGKTMKLKLLDECDSFSLSKNAQIRGIPNFNYMPGQIDFAQTSFKRVNLNGFEKMADIKNEENGFQVFGGKGARLVPKNFIGQ